jgi:serine/threonine protein kinase
VIGGRQYELLEELGTGTFGTVYKAELQSVGGFRKEVALKVLHPMWDRHEDASQRFRDEARLLGQLRHRHIVQVDGLVRVSGRWAVVMEYIPGWDGNVVIKASRKAGEPIPIPTCLEVCGAVAAALDAAWSSAPRGERLQVIHRDIKPSNIRLSPDGDIKVLDFGIASARFAGREAMTQSIRYGSVRYMSPERRQLAPDTASGDVYALGAVLYEFLVGRPLGNAETDWNQHTTKVRAAMERVRRRCGTDAGPVITLLEGMLQFAESRRPTAADVAERCRKLARTIHGEDLATFARRFLPQVDRWVDGKGRPVNRLVEADRAAVEKPQRPVGAVLPSVFTEARAPSLLDDLLPVRLSAVACMLALLAQFATAPEPVRVELARGEPVVVGATYAAALAVPESSARVARPETSSNPEPTATPPVPGRATAPEDGARPIPAASPAPTAEASDPPSTGTSELPATPLASPSAGEAPLRAAKFTAIGAERITASCVGAQGEGTESTLVRQLYAGSCTVRAVFDGVELSAVVSVDEARGVSCSAEGGELTCR